MVYPALKFTRDNSECFASLLKLIFFEGSSLRRIHSALSASNLPSDWESFQQPYFEIGHGHRTPAWCQFKASSVKRSGRVRRHSVGGALCFRVQYYNGCPFSASKVEHLLAVGLAPSAQWILSCRGLI